MAKINAIASGSLPSLAESYAMAGMEEAEEIRRKNLLTLIDQRGGKSGGTSRLSEETGIAAAQISQWANRSLHSATGKPRTMRGDSARRIERALSLPANWMDANHDDTLPIPVAADATPTGYVRFDLFDGAAGMGAGVANSDYPEVIRQVDVAEWEIRRKLGFLPAPGRMKLITGRGPSMRPKIEDGDVVMIDTACTYFDGDDYYLINVDGEAQIKMLQKRIDGLYVVSSNPDFKEWLINPQDLMVCGKALIGLGLRRL
ncbi:S24 family peptidase [Stenotrophomonas sp. CW117]|uniref:S24 family peptidase n=1 Tax=Stenotrophomonas TaxID=40323 RepID=UPI001CE18542|nr:S24 family peptidase [Stenotrophomonas sp. CW117]